MTLIGLDFETYSAADLRSVGLHNYVSDPTFRPLLAAVTDGHDTRIIDFTDNDHEAAGERLQQLIGSSRIAAHNAGFERAVLAAMGLDLPSDRFLDSAVLARACGYGSGLEAAAPQILGTDKVAAGKDLIKLFSVPGVCQEDGDMEFNPKITLCWPEYWEEFKHYCQVDAELSLRMAQTLLREMSSDELDYAAITLDMNATGWPVDLESVRLMRGRSQANTDALVRSFRERTGADELNLASHKQLVEWCQERGVRATSFDERSVRRLIARLTEKMRQPGMSESKWSQYEQVLDLLRTKQELGGSSLKKLDSILCQTSADGRLRDQYLHVGAGATCRTTGRGVQMQNLKRLTADVMDMSTLSDPDQEWDNQQLAANLRQVFKAQHPDGLLIVGDFSSVESRGLAWQADEEWKLESYRNGDDLYKVLAGRIYDKYPNDVTKDERQIGKVAELACGYGAGADAVRSFAEGMGTDLTEAEAADLVRSWRRTNEMTVRYWYDLDRALRTALESHQMQDVRRSRMTVRLVPTGAPPSLCRQVSDDGLQSLQFQMIVDGRVLFRRWIHGATVQGRNVRYWKPSDRKTGDLWNDRYTDAKTGQTRLYSVYGGKLTGLLTQSLCREVFFQALRDVHEWVEATPDLRLVGQFHDEIVLEWGPMPIFEDGTTPVGGVSKEEAMLRLKRIMSTTGLRGFPLTAEVKADHRYTK